MYTQLYRFEAKQKTKQPSHSSTSMNMYSSPLFRFSDCAISFWFSQRRRRLSLSLSLSTRAIQCLYMWVCMTGDKHIWLISLPFPHNCTSILFFLLTTRFLSLPRFSILYSGHTKIHVIRSTVTIRLCHFSIPRFIIIKYYIYLAARVLLATQHKLVSNFLYFFTSSAPGVRQAYSFLAMAVSTVTCSLIMQAEGEEEEDDYVRQKSRHRCGHLVVLFTRGRSLFLFHKSVKKANSY